MIDLHWIAPLSEFIENEVVQHAARLIASVMTATFSLITFYLKLKDRRAKAPPKLAVSETSWDADSEFPLSPLPFKIAPFPFIPSDLTNRRISQSGWYTATELRIWNAGKGIVFGPSVKQTTVAQICIPSKVGKYEVRWSKSNDPEMKFNLGYTTRDIASSEDRIPIFFDFMPAGKGILISIWHNSANGDGIRIRAFSEQTPISVNGIHHPIRRPIVNFMNRLTDILLIPSAIITAYVFFNGNLLQSVIVGVFTWSIIWTAYKSRTFVLSPADLLVAKRR
jgi:hypothetical protein